MKKCLLTLLACVPAHAEWSGTVDASFIASFGRVETETLNVHAKALKETEKRDYVVELQRIGIDAESDAKKKDSWDLDTSIRWTERGNWYTASVAEAYIDRYFRFPDATVGDLQRYTVGYGGGYKFIETERGKVFFDLMGECSQQRGAEGEFAIGTGLRAGIDASWWLFPDRVELFATTKVTSGSNKGVDSKSGIRVGLSDRLHVAVKYDYRNLWGRSDGVFSIAVGGRF